MPTLRCDRANDDADTALFASKRVESLCKKIANFGLVRQIARMRRFRTVNRDCANDQRNAKPCFRPHQCCDAAKTNFGFEKVTPARRQPSAATAT
jgi:hypothetical protein